MIPIFYLKSGFLSFADKTILSEIELYISSGDRVCLVGRNGSGKSSLMKIINGEYEIDSGEIFSDPVIRVGFLKQEVNLRLIGGIYDFVLENYKDNLEENKYKADIILAQLSIDGNDLLENCSGGQLRRVCLAKSLIDSPDILLLDEPTNHLDITAIEWLESYIKGYQGAVICISHDRTFQENISNKVWWIDRGELRKSSKGFKFYDQWREEIIEAEEAALRKMSRKLEVEQGWLSTGVTARRKRNQKRLANLYRLRETYNTHQHHLRSAKARLELELIEEVKKTKFIIEVENISYSYPGKKLFDNFSFKVKKGEKIGVIGPNGVGKSTFIKLLTKQIAPDMGKVKLGTNIEITYFDQYRSELNPEHTLKFTLCPTGGDQIMLQGATMHVAAYLKKFMFNPKAANDKVSTLSGGEANRLLLAKALINPGNLFILDEPTNDLDMDSLEMLLEILADYSGTLIVVSHDRDFLERLVTRTLIFSNEKIIDLYGGYNDYLKYHHQNSSQTKTDKKPEKSLAKEQKNSSKKLSYKYVRLLEELPNQVEKIEVEIASIEQQLSIGDLYNTDHKKFHNLSARHKELEIELNEKLSQWLEIEQIKKGIEESEN